MMDAVIQLKVNARKIAPVFILAFTVTTFFSKVIYSGKTLYGSDFLAYFYPLKAFIFDHFSINGFVPLWNPFQFSGTPVIANIQASMFYPLGFLYYLMPTDAAYLYSTVLHSILAAVFMYLFVRSLGTSKTGAFLSGLLFGFNGYLVAHIYAGHLSFVQNYIWIPLVFFLVHRFFLLRQWNYALAAGLILGVQILGGFPQIAFYTILAMLLFFCYEAGLFTHPHLFSRRHVKGHPIRAGAIQGIPSHRRNAEYTPGAECAGNADAPGQVRHLLFTGSGAVLIIIIGFSFSAIQVLPTYEFLQLSTRAGGIPYEFAVMDSLPPINLITLFIPDFFGNPAQGTFWAGETTWQFWEFCAYVGLIPLLLVFMSIRQLMSDRMGLFFLFLALVSVFLAFGKYNPIYPLIYRLPGFHSFRVPAQILFLYIFSISVLAGKALDSVRDGAQFEKRRSHLFAACVLFIALAILAWVRLAPLDLAGLLLRLTEPPITDPNLLARMCQIVDGATLKFCAFALAFLAAVYLGSKKSFGGRRIACGLIGLCVIDLISFCFPMLQPIDIQMIEERGKTLTPIAESNNLNRAMIMGPCFIGNAGLWYGFRDIQGYDPLILKRYMEYINCSQGLRPDPKVVNLHYVRDVRNNLIRMLNLEYVVDCGRQRILKMQEVVPSAYLVHSSVIKAHDEVLGFMMSSDFSPLEQVVFEEKRGNMREALRRTGAQIRDQVQLSRKGSDDMKIRVQTNAPAYLVLGEIYYPGWKAFVDGNEKPLLRADYLFRALYLDPGTHLIRLCFSPQSFLLGAIISLACMVVVLSTMLCNRRRCGQGKGND